jgi:hypothetical protein
MNFLNSFVGVGHDLTRPHLRISGEVFPLPRLFRLLEYEDP